MARSSVFGILFCMILDLCITFSTCQEKKMYHFIFAPAQSDFWFREWVAWYRYIPWKLEGVFFFQLASGEGFLGGFFLAGHRMRWPCAISWPKTRSKVWRREFLGLGSFFLWLCFLEGIVDGRHPANQLRLVVYPIILQGFIHSGWLFEMSSTNSILTFKRGMDQGSFYLPKRRPPQNGSPPKGDWRRSAPIIKPRYTHDIPILYSIAA